MILLGIESALALLVIMLGKMFAASGMICDMILTGMKLASLE